MSDPSSCPDCAHKSQCVPMSHSRQVQQVSVTGPFINSGHAYGAISNRDIGIVEGSFFSRCFPVILGIKSAAVLLHLGNSRPIQRVPGQFSALLPTLRPLFSSRALRPSTTTSAMHTNRNSSTSAVTGIYSYCTNVE